MDLRLAISKAGHDKNKIYVIVDESEDSYELANGGTKPLDKTKIKKKIHVQVVKKLPEEIQQIASENKELDDELILKIIDSYSGKQIRRN